jgi:hypothetical protein
MSDPPQVRSLFTALIVLIVFDEIMNIPRIRPEKQTSGDTQVPPPAPDPLAFNYSIPISIYLAKN